MENSTVSLSTVIAIITSLLSMAAAGYGIVLKWGLNTYKEATDKRFTDLENSSKADEKELKIEVKELTNANHALEKTCLKLDGDVRVLTQAHDNSKRDIRDIEEIMVTKAEWEPRMKHVESLLETILKEVKSPGRYPSASGLSASKYLSDTKEKEPK